MDRLRITRSPGRLVLHGELDLETIPVLEDAVARLNSEDCTIDLSGVSFIDSTGIRCLLVARRDRPSVRFTSPSERVVNVLNVAGIADLIDRSTQDA